MASDPAPNGQSGAEGGDAQSAEAQRPEMEPMETNDVLIVGIGTALFAVAFLILLPMHASLERSGHGRWPWVALSGVVLGLFGLVYCRRRAQRISKVNGQ
jgi:hypothetical protein